MASFSLLFAGQRLNPAHYSLTVQQMGCITSTDPPSASHPSAATINAEANMTDVANVMKNIKKTQKQINKYCSANRLQVILTYNSQVYLTSVHVPVFRIGQNSLAAQLAFRAQPHQALLSRENDDRAQSLSDPAAGGQRKPSAPQPCRPVSSSRGFWPSVLVVVGYGWRFTFWA